VSEHARDRPRFGPAALAAALGMPPPTAEQAAVIAAPLAPAVVVAGAGSGKTETMSARVVWLVANGFVRPDQVLGLTFTTKAAAELGARVRTRLGQLRARVAGPDEAASDAAAPDGEPTVLTYHAYAARLVAEHALRLGVEPSVRLLSAAMCWQLAERVVRWYDADLPEIDNAEATVVAWTLDLAAELADHLVDPDRLRAFTAELADRASALPRSGAGSGRGRSGPGQPYAEVTKLLARARQRCALLPLVERYEQAKRAAGGMDFGDQMALAARVADRFAEVGRVERARYAVVLLDEYQDTGHAQLVLLRALFGGGHPVTAVGDPCQSIYGWRGASAGNLRRFAEHFPTAAGRPAPVLPLSTSFRNDQRVLDVANALSTPLRAAGVDVGVLSPGPAGGTGAVPCALLSTAEEEAAWVADRIAAVWATDSPLRLAGEPARSVAVLCRRRAQFEPVATALRARGVPFTLVGLGGLLATPQVRDVVSTLRVLADPAAGDALARLLTGARCRIGPRDLAALGRRARTLTTPAPAPPAPAPASPPADSPSADLEVMPVDTPWNAGATSRSAQEGPAHPSAPPMSPVPPPRVPASPPAPASPHADLEVMPLDTPWKAGATSRSAQEAAAQEGAAHEGVAHGGAGEEASLVEALDDLGAAEAYSAEGYRRLAALGAELAMLRRRTAQPLPDLIADVERTLLLDVEVAAAPEAGEAGRTHLDRFLDVAAAFAQDAEAPTLGAFLAYLAAAEDQERGLEAGTVEVEADRVQVLTVHAAKGLEWDVVAVPGLTAGVFPDRDSVGSAGWATSVPTLPYPLRGDAADLPEFDAAAAHDQRELDELRKDFVAACRERGEREERRLAYVAVTRARQLLLCSGYWWDTAKNPRGPSAFLTEIAEVAGVEVDAWTPPPQPDAANPVAGPPQPVPWPVDPLGDRRPQVEEGAALVRAALAVGGTGPGGSDPGPGPGADPDGADPDGADPDGADPDGADSDGADSDGADPDGALWSDEDLHALGWAREADLLLAERDRSGSGEAPTDVPLPTHLSVTDLVALRRDPAELARRIRRPMPHRPAPLARRGTAFHAWLEERFGGERLLDLDELPGAADDGAAPDADLALLQEKFLASPWAHRRPEEVEVPFETVVGDVVVRGRVDAVFRDADGGWTVVDWKTGTPPTGAAARAAEVQLAAYRLAWAELAGVPPDRVRAAFHYVRDGRTVHAADLLTAAELAALVGAVPAVPERTP
jgi:DNA helicase-2/ATP-dependent DNA helicase PcrA